MAERGYYSSSWLAENFKVFSETTSRNDLLVGANNIREVLCKISHGINIFIHGKLV